MIEYIYWGRKCSMNEIYTVANPPWVRADIKLITKEEINTKELH
jgi:hypothetical protein